MTEKIQMPGGRLPKVLKDSGWSALHLKECHPKCEKETNEMKKDLK